jgi:GNAT superfamily N-acetyltransferase
MSLSPVSIQVRSATEEDLNDVAGMVSRFAEGHPAQSHPRPISRLREAYFGASPVAHLLVATKGPRVIGMGQWTRIYDMFWAMFGGYVEWLFVIPELRGQGIAPAIIAEICCQVRLAGGEFLRGGADGAEIAALYERVAIGAPAYGFNLSASAFQNFADLAGLQPREIVRRLPHPDLNGVAASTVGNQPGSPA